MRRNFAVAVLTVTCLFFGVSFVRADSTPLNPTDAGPSARATQRVGVTEITTDYHRPLVRGRKNSCGLRPCGGTRRAGADYKVTAVNLLPTSDTRTQMNNIPKPVTAADQPIRVLELRNYVTRPGQRDKFISYFETNFIGSQNALGGYILGQFTVEGADDNFFWMRGFNDMASRSRYLPEFYRGAFWKQRRDYVNAMLLNNDNVYLLKPLGTAGDSPDAVVNSNEFGKKKGLVVIDYYVANTRLKELIEFFRSKYLPFLRGNGISTTPWVSELTENDFPWLPVFQDKNLLVTITPFKDEGEYRLKLKQINAGSNQQILTELREIVTTRTTVILHPTKNSFSN